MYATLTKDVSFASSIVKEGRIVAFPTGTSYGLAVDALQGHALQRLRNLKQRPAEKSFTIFLKESLWDTYLDITHTERELLRRYAHAALTLLVSPKESLAHLAQDGMIGLRVVDHPMMEQFADIASVPLTATSANISGHESCYTTQAIHEEFPGKDGTTYDLSLGCILDGGDLHPGRVSTIARYVDGKMNIVRQGSLVLA